MKKPFLLLIVLLTQCTVAQPAQVTGPLRVCKENPRYFSDSTGKPVYLTGTHTWNTFQDYGTNNPPPVFDYQAYLNFLTRNGHNFTRMWTWEHPRWAPWDEADVFYFAPVAYNRSNVPGANDGGNKFDLRSFNPVFFERLHQRVSQAGDRGIYVSVMLFNGGSIGNRRWKNPKGQNPFRSNVFNATNNINGIDGDPNHDGQGWETHVAGATPGVWEYQKAYLRKLLDTLNDLDNVLYEVSNEDPDASMQQWQYDVINYVHQYEKTKPKQHPVGMTQLWAWEIKDMLWKSPADWISPALDRNDPAPADGSKVVLADSDHVGSGNPIDPDFVWRLFLRGHNVLGMEHNKAGIGSLEQGDFRDGPGDLAQGDARRWALRLPLEAMQPDQTVSSTKFCLARAGREYLVFQPNSGGFEVNLPKGTYSVEWFNPVTRATQSGPLVTVEDRPYRFSPPFEGLALLHLKLRNG